MAENWDEHAHDERREHHAEQGIGARDMKRVHEIADHENGEDVEEHPVDIASTHAGEDIRRVFLDHVEEGYARFALLGLERRELGRLENAQANINADADEDHAEQEGHSPAPGQKLRIAQKVREQGDDAGSKAKPN